MTAITGSEATLGSEKGFITSSAAVDLSDTSDASGPSVSLFSASVSLVFDGFIDFDSSDSAECVSVAAVSFTASVSALEVLSWVSVGFSFVACGMTTETFWI